MLGGKEAMNFGNPFKTAGCVLCVYCVRECAGHIYTGNLPGHLRWAHPTHSPFYFLRQGLSLNLKLADLVRLASQ